MTDELATPLNIHRFRTLPASDPPLADLLSKCAVLQKRLIARADEIEKLEGEVGRVVKERDEWMGRYERGVRVWGDGSVKKDSGRGSKVS
jgi:hypothetical protein